MAKNLFESAKNNAPVTTKKKGQSKKTEVRIEGLDDLTMVDAAIKALESLKADLSGNVKQEIRSIFVNAGLSVQKKPDNFTGTDDNSSASCELRKRSTASALSDGEIELLSEYGVSVEENIKTEETYIINPAYKDDGKLLRKVSNALTGIKDIPEDFIQFQPQISTKVVSDTSLDEIFKMDVTKEQIVALIDVVSVIAIKPKSNESVDLKKTLSYISKNLF